MKIVLCGLSISKISREGRAGVGGMVLEGGLPAPLQLYAAAAAQLAPRPTWPPFLPFFGVPPPFLTRPRLPHPMPRAPHGPPSEDSNEDGGSSKGNLIYLYDSDYIYPVFFTNNLRKRTS